MRFAGIAIIVLLLLLLAGQGSKQEEVIAYPKVYIASMHCTAGMCQAVFRNVGLAEAECKDVELFADGNMVALLSDLKDRNGQACERIGAGKYTIVVMPDYCRNADRLSVKTHIRNLANDTMLEGIYTANFICR